MDYITSKLSLTKPYTSDSTNTTKCHTKPRELQTKYTNKIENPTTSTLFEKNSDLIDPRITFHTKPKELQTKKFIQIRNRIDTQENKTPEKTHSRIGKMINHVKELSHRFSKIIDSINFI